MYSSIGANAVDTIAQSFVDRKKGGYITSMVLDMIPRTISIRTD